MAGMKGRSGRKSHYDSLLIAEVVDLSIKTVRDYLRDEKIPFEKKVMVAKDFALKRMPQKIEGSGLTDTQIIIVREKEKQPGNIGRVLSEEIPG